MHESRIVTDILAAMERVADANDARRIACARIEIGALSHITPEGFVGHFGLISQGSVADGADLDITRSNDRNSPDAFDVRLVSLVVEGE